MLAADSDLRMGLCQGLIPVRISEALRGTAGSYERSDCSVVKGALEIVFEFVQEYVRVRRGDDGLLARDVTAEDSPGGRSLLLGLSPAQELDFRLRTVKHAYRAHLMDIGAVCGR